jgi:hypothetical protein
VSANTIEIQGINESDMGEWAYDYVNPGSCSDNAPKVHGGVKP